MEKVIIGNATLYCGDSLEILPTLKEEKIIITDPPFGIGFKYESHDDNPEEYPLLMKQVIKETERLRGQRPAIFWQAMKHADRWHEWFPKGFRIFAACKGFVQFRPTAVQFSWDPVIFWGNVKTEASVYRKDFHVQSLAPFGAGREMVNHPCPRPLEQVAYIVDVFSCAGDEILDPFMGSGTTGVACLNQGRRFVGIEKDRKYFDLACKRIEDSSKQGSLFSLESPEQLALLTNP